MTIPSSFRLAALIGLGLLAPAAAAQDAPPAPDWTRSIDAISTLLADRDGDLVPDQLGAPALVAGRVTVGTGVLRSDIAEIYVQDGTGGLRLFLPPDAARVLSGDSVMVSGTLGFRAGMAEMVAPSIRTVTGTEGDVSPIRLNAVERERGRRGPDIEGHEGEVVEVEGRVLEIADSPSGQALVILSGTDLIQVFSYTARPEPVVFDALRIGDYVRVTGVASQSDPEAPFTGGYVVYPLVQADVRKSGLSPTEYRYSVIGAVVLLLVALLWAVALRRQVRRRSEALRASEVRYGHLFDAAADPVVVLDVNRGGEIVEANRAAQKAFGIDVNGDRADGRPVRLSELAADEQESALHLAEAEARGAASGTLELLDGDGTAVPYEIATRQLRDRSTFVAVARNVTERRNYEHGLLTAISAAEEAREQAEEAARLKSSILANMSHEIRTPLTAILGFADILREEVPEDLYEYADTIHGGGQRLLDTLNDILDFARLDAERASVLPESIDAAVVVRESVGLLAPLAQRKGLGLHLQSSSTSVPAVHSASALGRVITNLVGNAIKFTEKGEVRVSLHAAPTFFAIRVQDTGVGIADAFLPELYEAFKQESDGHRRDFEGTGLGLAITKRIVDLMGGEIRVWSKKGEGTLFEVALPMESPSGPEAPHVDAAFVGDGAGDGAAETATLGLPA
ncbi:ATP-binding protein [Rubrivirga sp. IMCC43871]|uniref:ATP-binding protein n=1 Tax=Rubrivirga sp. IMCC43871 TaxID=3391575 RepID=UPI003990053B